jgi:hypothetical protein
MNDSKLSDLLSLVLIQETFTDAHVADFRRLFFNDGTISIQEADQLFEINNLKDKTENWNELFTEAITAFLVYQTMPIGYINQANAVWLMTRISSDGVVESRTELELLLKVMKVAKNVAPELEQFALKQVEHAVIDGSGVLSQDRTLEPGVIGEAEVDLIRRVIYACSSEGGISITKMEAEVLCDLNDATADVDNHESWQKLYVGALANHLMVVAAWEEPDLQEAVRSQKWLEAPVGGIFKPSFSGLLKRGLSIFTSEENAQFSHMDAKAVASAERVTEREASWLIERLNRDGVLNANEIALLKFLEEECPNIHSSLVPMIKAA